MLLTNVIIIMRDTVLFWEVKMTVANLIIPAIMNLIAVTVSVKKKINNNS